VISLQWGKIFEVMPLATDIYCFTVYSGLQFGDCSLSRAFLAINLIKYIAVECN